MTLERRRTISIGGVLLTWAACSAITFGQYAPGMDGHNNDASNQAGSGGFNSPVAQPLFNAGNLFITGNVSGGRAFRGFNAVRDPNSLYVNVPTASIGGFQRDTIGLNEVLRNQTLYQTNPYYIPSQSVTTTAAAAATNPRQPYGALPGSTFYIPQAGSQPGTPPSPVDLGPGYHTPDTTVPYSSFYTADSNALLRGDDNARRLRQSQDIEALRQSPIFGRSVSVTSPIVSRNSEGASSPLDGASAADNAVSPWIQPFQRRSRIIDGSDQPLPGEMKNNVQTVAPNALAPRLFNSQPVALNRQPSSAQNGVTTTSVGGVASAPLGSQPVATTAAPDPGANATSYFGAEEPASAPNNLAALPAAAQIVNQVDENPEVQGNLASMPSLKAQYDRAVTVLQTASTKSVDTLAGDVNTKANEYIRQGEEAARNGKYYEAASLYRMAAQTEPDNPLIRIGLGHALAAAGEYLTAVLHLTQAIDHYPAFGYLNFELQNFVPDSRILDIRRADLERLLDKKEDYQLRFLLGYMEFYSGLEKFGVPNLEKAAHAAPAGSVIARFPSMIEKRAAVIPNPEKPQ